MGCVQAKASAPGVAVPTETQIQGRGLCSFGSRTQIKPAGGLCRVIDIRAVTGVGEAGVGRGHEWRSIFLRTADVKRTGEVE